jgi:polar amino acid transport system substrate-binding protein
MHLHPSTAVRCLLTAGLLGLCALAFGAPAEIRFIAPTNHVMPLAGFDGQTLRQGILKDLGDAIAQRLGVTVRFISLPSKRVSAALAAGTADGVCYVMPEWIDGAFNWSNPVLPNHGVVTARAGTAPVASIQALADQPVGTVIGYRYPDFEQTLGRHFVREDALDMTANLLKLEHGRMAYAIMEQTTFAYHQRTPSNPRLAQVLQYSSFKTQCAFSQRSAIAFADISRAIDALAADGSIEKILARYR